VKVVFVVGTTASGKSAYAFAEALRTGGAIINCDSVQLYQGLVIGSALPSEAEMNEVPHFLFSYVAKGSKMTAGQYARDFYETMKKINNQFPIVYVVGGTGFYFQAIEKGLFDVQRPNSQLRNLIEDEMKTEVGAEKIYQEMITLDPLSAQRIHRNDHYRIARAVELMRVEKKPLSQIWNEFEEKKFKFPYLYDESQSIARTYGAIKTPHVFIVQKEAKNLVLKYTGAIDDNWENAVEAKEKYVESAVDALLAGKPITTTFTKAIGCGVKWKK